MRDTLPGEIEPALILVDKPVGVTSHDVVDEIRRDLRPLNAGRLLVGHCGTLDPMASGLLIVLVGQAVKVQADFLRKDKEYTAVIQLGIATDTGDKEGKMTKQAAVSTITPADLERVKSRVIGTRVQPVPLYAAAKVAGRKLYEYARANQEPPWRPIRYSTVKELVWGDYNKNNQTLAFSLTCNAGTYVRSVAELIAAELGTVGHLIALRRTASGEWRLN